MIGIDSLAGSARRGAMLDKPWRHAKCSWPLFVPAIRMREGLSSRPYRLLEYSVCTGAPSSLTTAR